MSFPWSPPASRASVPSSSYSNAETGDGTWEDFVVSVTEIVVIVEVADCVSVEVSVGSVGILLEVLAVVGEADVGVGVIGALVCVEWVWECSAV